MRETNFDIPPVTPFVECPNCKRLIEYGVALCPTCREEIDPQYAITSATIVMTNTQACSMANTLKSAEAGAFIALIAGIAGFFLVDPSMVIVTILTPVVSLAAVLVWFWRYRSFMFGDEEFIKAKSRMRTSLKLWTALLVVQALTVAYMYRAGLGL